MILPNKFTTCSQYQNVEESLIQVCVFFGYLRKENHCAMATPEKKRVSPAGKIKIWHCGAVLFLQVLEQCTDQDLSLLYILVLGTHGKFARDSTLNR